MKGLREEEEGQKESRGRNEGGREGGRNVLVNIETTIVGVSAPAVHVEE